MARAIHQGGDCLRAASPRRTQTTHHWLSVADAQGARCCPALVGPGPGQQTFANIGASFHPARCRPLHIHLHHTQCHIPSTTHAATSPAVLTAYMYGFLLAAYTGLFGCFGYLVITCWLA
jgi:hypothetical protein